MAISLLHKSPPVWWRWFRRQKQWHHAALLAVCLTILPLSVLGGIHASRTVSMNVAQASSDVFASLPLGMDGLSERDQERHLVVIRRFIADDVARLMALSESDLVRVMPAPGLERREGPVTVRQYRSDHCVLDVFTRPDDAGQDHIVAHYDVRRRIAPRLGMDDSALARESATPDLTSCLASLL